MCPEMTLPLIAMRPEGAHVSHLLIKLKDLNATVQELGRSPQVSERDLLLLEEAQHACDVGTEFVLNHRPVQARYAYAFAELCLAVVQDKADSESMRRLLEGLLQ
jgi:hypothetical protein